MSYPPPNARLRPMSDDTAAASSCVRTDTLIQERDAVLQLDAAAVSSDIGLKRALGGG